ncbi:hypothetical protein EGW08_009821 [Elysia chlorotica]|uniref:Uncharacterized protein n=1 Tax=Elysia chlorotica TaxID=188477 RepID=A0A433TLF6_ELYCH|nr:hypothetical protein EGW08_009821 [Elysia chlorotica]
MTVPDKVRLAGSMMLLWQLSITSEMIGLEATIVMEVILMIANLQTLGVPVRYCSLPGTVAAIVSFFLIPCLAFVLDKWAKSKQSKAKILAFTTAIQILGSSLVLLANGLNLRMKSVLKSNDVANLTDSLLLDNMFAFNETSLADRKNLLGDVFGSITPYTVNTLQSDSVDGALPFYTYIAMIGYTLIDCGYDSSNCFLKTFVLHCAPVEYHRSLIIKLTMVSSIGGGLISILGSLDLGQIFTAGAGLDSSSAMTCLMAALTTALLLSGTLSTFACGFWWKPPLHRNESEYGTKCDEQAALVPVRDIKLKSRGNGLVKSPDRAMEPKQQSYSHSGTRISSPRDTKRDQSVDIRLDEPNHSGIQGYMQRQQKQLLINASAFFLFSSNYAFDMYLTNFSGTRVFGGDPKAPSDSQSYQRYMDGLAAGSRGVVIQYIVFAVTNCLHEQSLAAFGE